MSNKEVEKKYLIGVQSLIEIISNKLSGQLNKSTNELIEERKFALEEFGSEISDDAQIEYSQVLPSLKMQEEISVNRNRVLKSLDKMHDRPYFGAVTIHDEETEKLYIGLNALKDPSTEDIIIYDWRTPVASTYYENKIGLISYQVPGVGMREVKVLARIQLVIEDGELKDVFDSEIYIGDDALQHLLVDTAKDKMKSIVTTIQQDQNTIIRESSAEDILVLGPPGSGKTSVAMQRVAYLLYLHRHKMSEENMLFLTPNEMFKDYIGNVLPELGEAPIDAMPFYRLSDQLNRKDIDFETLFEHIERMRERNEDDIHLYHLKSGHEMLGKLKEKIDVIENGGISFNIMTINGEPFMTQDALKEMFYDRFQHSSISTRLNKMKVEMLTKFNDVLEKSIRERKKALKRVEKYIGTDEELEQRAVRERTKQFRVVRHYIERLQFVNIEKIYLSALKELDTKAYKITLNHMKAKTLMYEDIAPLVYLTAEIKGLGRQQKIRHLMIDEVQDYSPMMMAAIDAVFYNAKKTMLGDRNQIVHPVHEFSTNKQKVIELTKSYRSTVEITEFTKSLINNTTTESLGVKGDEVQTLDFESFASLVNALDSESVLISTKSVADAVKLGEVMGEDYKVITHDDYTFKHGKLIMPDYMAKGFEFSHVFITDYDQYDKTQDALLLYTLASRATRNLYLVNGGPACSSSSSQYSI